jgi:hypothetical protein
MTLANAGKLAGSVGIGSGNSGLIDHHPGRGFVANHLNVLRGAGWRSATKTWEV